MKWIEHYELVLFDLDGLLVDSERAHYLGYRKMCAQRGFDLGWNFAQYCSAAYSSSQELKRRLLERVPSLKEIDWKELYQEKSKYCIDALRAGEITLMPGVEQLLFALQEAGIASCVVTNSSQEMTAILRKRFPSLDLIPNWITREDYKKPKPDPEGYLLAINRWGKKRVIGFEDTVKGLSALKQVIDRPVLICDPNHPQMEEVRGVAHFSSFTQIPDESSYETWIKKSP